MKKYYMVLLVLSVLSACNSGNSSSKESANEIKDKEAYIEVLKKENANLLKENNLLNETLKELASKPSHDILAGLSDKIFELPDLKPGQVGIQWIVIFPIRSNNAYIYYHQFNSDKKSEKIINITRISGSLYSVPDKFPLIKNKQVKNAMPITTWAAGSDTYYININNNEVEIWYSVYEEITPTMIEDKGGSLEYIPPEDKLIETVVIDDAMDIILVKPIILELPILTI